MADMKKYPLVMIEWDDSMQPSSGWTFLSDYTDFSILRIKSVGWLVKDGKKVKVLAPNIGGESDHLQSCGIIKIPSSAVRKVRRL